MCRHDLLYD
jgi:hypothetical protein